MSSRSTPWNCSKIPSLSPTVCRVVPAPREADSHPPNTRSRDRSMPGSRSIAPATSAATSADSVKPPAGPSRATSSNAAFWATVIITCWSLALGATLTSQTLLPENLRARAAASNSAWAAHGSMTRGSIISFFSTGPAGPAAGSRVCRGSGTRPAQTTIWKGVSIISIFRRMQASGAGPQFDVAALRIARTGLGAIPQACPAVDAFLAVEGRGSVRAGRDGLAGTGVDADPRPAFFTGGCIDELHMVGVTRRGLHLAAEKQGILVRHQQLSIERNGRPAGPVHEERVQGDAPGPAFLAHSGDFRGGNPATVIFLEGRQPPVGRGRTAPGGKAAAAQSRQAHADQSPDKSLLKAVPGFFRDASLLLHPAGPAPPHVNLVQVVPRERT